MFTPANLSRRRKRRAMSRTMWVTSPRQVQAGGFASGPSSVRGFPTLGVGGRPVTLWRLCQPERREKSEENKHPQKRRHRAALRVPFLHPAPQTRVWSVGHQAEGDAVGTGGPARDVACSGRFQDLCTWWWMSGLRLLACPNEAVPGVGDVLFSCHQRWPRGCFPRSTAANAGVHVSTWGYVFVSGGAGTQDWNRWVTW